MASKVVNKLFQMALEKPVQMMSSTISYFTISLFSIQSWLTNWFRWRPTSLHELNIAEEKVLSFLQRPYSSFYVDIGEDWGLKSNKIWTLSMTPEGVPPEKQGLPIVLLHGFASAVGLWIMNLDSFVSSNRRLFAIDILGFGKSSRPKLNYSESSELELVESIERWRSKIGLNEKFVILGHSFGGYLALSYALRYPERVAHLILADPWGIPSHQQTQIRNHQYPIPFWVKVVATMLFQTFSPLAGLRAAGPWGPRLIEKLRPDLKRKFEPAVGTENTDHILSYIYHCNAQSNPSGELAFKSLALPMGWAKFPMINRVTELDANVSLTFVYGSRSWVDRQPGFQIKYLLGEHRVNVHVINGAGHHVYADKADEFNDIVCKTCYFIDDRIIYEQNLGNNNEDDDDDYNSDENIVEVLDD